jgi:nicotinate-nucleotide pyrophosphorylase (carboxylating)
MIEITENLKKEIKRSVKVAIEEDVGEKDLTCSLIEDIDVTAKIITREDMILSGQAWAKEVYKQIDPEIHTQWHFNDGVLVNKDTVISEIHGRRNTILTGERCVLNFLQILSSTATQTKSFVEKIKNSNCKILDTRKTLPGMRLAQKYAVRCGGGVNHRFGLYDSVLLKENHLEGRTDIAELILSAKRLYPDTDVIVEVESIDELKIVLSTEANRALLDNFSIDELKMAYELKLKSHNQNILLEASGNITHKNIREIAGTGIDFVSVGALTKNIKAIDLTLLINPR